MNNVDISWSKDLPDLIRDLGSVLATSMRESVAIVIEYSKQSGLKAKSYSYHHAGGITCHQNNLCITGRNGYYAFKAVDYSGSTLHLLKSKVYFGLIQPHELHSNNSKVWVGNTGFNCIAEVNEQSSFQPFWYPPFIDQSESIGDRCHLNGFALSPETQLPEYVSLFSSTNRLGGWREANVNTGCIYQISSNIPICKGLLRPHSPVVNNKSLYFLESGSGKLIEFDRETNDTREVHQVLGFVRGLKIHDEIAIFGISVFRESFMDLPNKHKDVKPGLKFIDLRNGSEIGEIVFNCTVSEIFAVSLLVNEDERVAHHILDEGHGRYVSLGKALPDIFA